MRRLILLSFALLASAAAHADDKRIVRCNITNGDIAEITIRQSPAGAISAQLLTDDGTMLNPIAVDAAIWETRDLDFKYHGGHIRFYQDETYHWWFQEFDSDHKFPSLSGNGDCDYYE
jgi:hypothetical protein